MQVGVARIDISPTGRIKREGYLLESYVDGVHDPIYASGLVLQHGQTKFGILCCDLLWLERGYTDPIARDIEAATGIATDHLMVTCSHTHSAPQVTDNAMVSKEEQYVNDLAPKMVQAMVEANNNLVDAKIAVAKGREDTVQYNSRYLSEDGTILWRGPREGESVTSTGPIDPDVGIISFADSQDQVIATFYNFACHTSSASYGQISADYPGLAAPILAEQIGGLSLYTRGSCGNIHPQKDAEPIGVKLASAVAQQVRAASFLSCDVLVSIKEQIDLPLRDLDPTEMDRIDYICDRTNPATAEDRKLYFRKCYAAFEALRAKTDTLRTFVQVIRMGDAVLVGIPGEQFVQDGLAIKARSPFEKTFIVNLANDSIGYIPTRKAYDEGGYQTWIGACNVAPEAGEMLVDKALHLIGKL